MTFAIALPIYWAGKAIAVKNGVDLRLWCFYGFAVGVYLSRPICTWLWPDRIVAGDEAAAKRIRAVKSRSQRRTSDQRF